MSGYFENKVAVVTGAASGIGLGITERLLSQGGRAVFMADITEENLEREAARLRELHPDKIFPMLTDVTKSSQVTEILRAAKDLDGHLDFVFNNAGRGATLPTEQVTLDLWRHILDLNVMGVVHGTYGAIPIMREQGFGHIVNTASLAGLVPIPYQAVYVASKSAVISMTESLQYELECEGLQFSVICPSNIQTPIFGDLAPPPDSISVNEAMDYIFQELARPSLVIALPESARNVSLYYRTRREEFDEFMRGMAKERRENYRTKGTYF
ncbi:MAG TPA: SDR family oxidoreductase [Synergistaceae bacterium]|nr:SDR family oxidoreductase [Synergistaceae bacterium]HPJ26955.1 SDR family oxidoreductase [Synergistaceae bacterium]HPQ38383.1 SDR family oxidoreductase [Synergistaceae bacterium]